MLFLVRIVHSEPAIIILETVSCQTPARALSQPSAKPPTRPASSRPSCTPRWCPIPQTAARYIADDLAITFTGGRKYRHPRETTAFNAKRYKWVKKKMERTDVVPGEGETIVYNTRHALRRMAGRHAVRRQPLRRPLRRARRQDRADGCLERQRRAAPDQGGDRGLVSVAVGPDPDRRCTGSHRAVSGLPLDARARLPAQARRSIVGVTRQNGLDVAVASADATRSARVRRRPPDAGPSPRSRGRHRRRRARR